MYLSERTEKCRLRNEMKVTGRNQEEPTVCTENKADIKEGRQRIRGDWTK